MPSLYFTFYIWFLKDKMIVVNTHPVQFYYKKSTCMREWNDEEGFIKKYGLSKE